MVPVISQRQAGPETMGATCWTLLVVTATALRNDTQRVPFARTIKLLAHLKAIKGIVLGGRVFVNFVMERIRRGRSMLNKLLQEGPKLKMKSLEKKESFTTLQLHHPCRQVPSRVNSPARVFPTGHAEEKIPLQERRLIRRRKLILL